MAEAAVASHPDAGSTLVKDENEETLPILARRRHGLSAGSYLLSVAALVVINFFLPLALPGDPIDALLDPGAVSYVQDENLRSELSEYYGLDRGLGEQFADYLGDLVGGELGTSIRYNTPVADLIGGRLPWTLLLVLAAVTTAAVVGLIAGVHSGWHRGRSVDRGMLSLFLTIRNLPVFFLASIALFVFGVKLGWVPLAGARTPFAQFDSQLAAVADVAHHLVVPAGVLAARFVADDYLYMRAGMVGELGAGYLLLGRAKGLRERRLKYRHAARNALLPVVSLVAIQPTQVLTAAIFVAAVFAYPGLGRLVFDSVSYRDYPTLQACFLMISLAVVTASFLTDVALRRLDPRIGGRQ
ncbi:ABC transporter permease [soil metagenome]